MKHFAVIPVKNSSERVENKNFRPFLGGKSLLDLKIGQLQASGAYSEIFVSSDSPIARESAKKHGTRFLERPARFCNNVIPWSDVIVEVVSSLPVDDDCAVSWCHVTSPLFSDFGRAIRKFETLSDEYNGLFAVSRLNRFILNSKFRPLNYQWGLWHPYSQNLEPYYFVTGSLFMARKRDFLDARYVITSRPFALETSEREAFDIDSQMEFEMAQWLAQREEASPVAK